MREAQVMQMSVNARSAQAKAGATKAVEPLSPQLMRLLMIQSQHRQCQVCCATQRTAGR